MGVPTNRRASLTREDSLRRSFSAIAVSHRRSSTSNVRVRRSSHKEKDSDDDDDDGYRHGHDHDDHNLKRRPSPPHHQKASLVTRSNRRASNLSADTLANRMGDFSMQDEEFEQKLQMKIKEKQQQQKKTKKGRHQRSAITDTPQEVQPQEEAEQVKIAAEDAKVILNSYYSKPTIQRRSTHQHKHTHQEQPHHESQVEQRGYRPDYNVGDSLRSPTHIIDDQAFQSASLLSSINALTRHDCAFVKRSNGTYSYAIIGSRSKQQQQQRKATSDSREKGEEEEFLLFVMNKEGAIKKIHKRHWCQLIRLVDTATMIP